MSVSSTWSLTNYRNDHPLCHIFTISKIKKIQVIWCKATSTSCSTINNHLKLINSTTSMCSSGWWSNTSSFQFLPFECHHIQSICITCNNILTCISSCSTEQYDFSFWHLCDCMPKSCQWYFSESIHFWYLISIARICGSLHIHPDSYFEILIIIW